MGIFDRKNDKGKKQICTQDESRDIDPIGDLGSAFESYTRIRIESKSNRAANSLPSEYVHSVNGHGRQHVKLGCSVESGMQKRPAITENLSAGDVRTFGAVGEILTSTISRKERFL